MRLVKITTLDELRRVDHRAAMLWERRMREDEKFEATAVRQRLAALSSLFDHLVRFNSILPSYLKDLTRFAYHTGWRKGEILSLEWRDIEGDVIRLRPEIAKNKTGRMIVLVGEVENIIAQRRQMRVESCPYVFHREGNPIKHFDGAWRTAREKVGLSGLLFHDIRRTAVMNMDRVGVPRQTAKQITGHKTDAVYNRYRIVNEQDIREGMTQVQDFLKHGHKADNNDLQKYILPISN